MSRFLPARRFDAAPLMPAWFDKARETITRRPGRFGPEPFGRVCVCGESIGGERRAQAQEVECAGCGREWFILPIDPYPRPRSSMPKGRRRTIDTSAEGDAAPAANGRPAPNAALQPAVPRQPARPPIGRRAKERVAAAKQALVGKAQRAARPLRLVGIGILALLFVTGVWLWHRARVEAASATLVSVVPQAEQAIAERDFATAGRLFAEAAAAVDVLGADDATAARIRQRHRELVALNGLAAQTPYDLAAQAERVGVDPANWSDQFAAVHAGRWLILDVPLGEPEDPTPISDSAEPDHDSDPPAASSGKVVPLDLPLAVGKFPVRFEIDAAVFTSIKPRGRAIFAAQYETWRLRRNGEGPSVWVVRLQPSTAFAWCSPDLYASLGFDLDAEVDPPRPLLARQAEALGVPFERPEAGPAKDAVGRK